MDEWVDYFMLKSAQVLRKMKWKIEHLEFTFALPWKEFNPKVMYFVVCTDYVKKRVKL